MSYCICIENENNFCMFCKVFVENLNLETSWEFIFATTFHKFGLNWQQLNSVNIKFPLRYIRDCFSLVSLTNWFSTIFCILICAFPDIHLFLISCNLLRFCNRLWTFSTHFCSFANRFCSFLLVYQSFLLVSTCLPFTSCLYSFMRRSSHFYSCTQGSTTSFIKLGLKRESYQLESSLASHFGGTFSPGGTTTCLQRNFSGHKESCKYCKWYFDQFLERILLRLGSNGIALNLMKCVFSKDSVRWLFSKDGNKPDRSELEEIEEVHTPKNAKNLRN